MKNKIDNIGNVQLEESVLVELPMSMYLKFFGNERIEKIEFLPLLEGKEAGMNKYDINWKKFNKREELLFRFFSQNIGQKVEVGIIYGFQNCILESGQFIIGGTIEESFIVPSQNHRTIEYRSIYYAKCIANTETL